ncbi:MAG TPA: hypothetical protein VFB54_07335 [Burkholderiales bacterium]|nr:hypothetical protein [Burkholderiales bacterium]
MDTQRDFAPFRKLLDQLCVTFDRPPAKDELVNAYWDALRDARFDEVSRNVARIIRTATEKTRWPKPGQLRDAAPDERAHRTASEEAGFRAAIELNRRTWSEFEARDPQLYAIEIAIARCARILATDHESTPQHAEARALDWRLRQRRWALLAERAKAVTS